MLSWNAAYSDLEALACDAPCHSNHQFGPNSAEVTQPHIAINDITYVFVRTQRELPVAPFVTDEDIESVALQPLKMDMEMFECSRYAEAPQTYV